MVRYLKSGMKEDRVVAEAAKGRSTVEGILADIAERGDIAGCELSGKDD